MGKEVSDKVGDVQVKGRTRVPFPPEYEPIPQFDTRTDMERSLGEVIRKLAERAGYKVGDEVEYQITVTKR